MSAQARPQDYARAIYDLALEAWGRQLSDVQRALRGDPALHARVKDSANPVSARLKLLDSATQGGLNESVRRFLGTLLEAGQLDQLDTILVEFNRLALHRAERRIAHVTSAVPLTQAEREALSARLTTKFGSDLEFQYDVDAALLGGVRLRVGDQVIDGSVSGRLAAMRDRLTA